MEVFKSNVSLEATPTSDTHIVNKKYVDDIVPTDTHIKEISLLGEKVADTTKYGADILYFPCGVHIFESNAIASNFINAPVKQAGTFYVTSITPNKDMNTDEYVYRNYRYETYYGEIYTRSLMKGSTSDGIRRDSGWVRICNTKDIVTTIDDTCTDNQIASAKAVNDSTPKFMRRGTSNTNIPKGSDLNNYITPGTYTCNSSADAKTLLHCPYNGGNFKLFVIQNTGNNNGTDFWGWQKIVSGHVSGTVVWYRSVYTSNSTIMFGTWDKVCTTKVADVPKTTITTFDNDVFSGTIYYKIINGICYLHLYKIKSTESGIAKLILSNLPKSSITQTGEAYRDTDGNTVGLAYVNENATTLKMHVYITNAEGHCTFSYPVAES